MNMEKLVPLLGVDKSNPLLELLVNPDFPDEILVHYGMYLLEKVNNTGKSIEKKLLSGRLYNAGLKRKNLTKVFGWDLKTIRGYAAALRSGDADRLRSVLSGQGGERKIGEKERRFVRAMYREVHEEQKCHTNKYIRDQLLSKLGVDVSRETIRQLIIKEKEEGRGEQEEISKPDICEENAPYLPTTGPPFEEASRSDDVPEQTGADVIGTAENSDEKGSVEVDQKIGTESRSADENASETSLPAIDNSRSFAKMRTSATREIATREGVNEGQPEMERHCSEKDNACSNECFLGSNVEKKRNTPPSPTRPLPTLKPNGEPQFLFHGGLLMVLNRIFQIGHMVGDVADQTHQWLASILSGAVNIEQSSTLDFASLAIILGQRVLSDESQRSYLHEHALTDAVTQLRRANVQLTSVGLEDLFLYDPHGIKYTGQAKILRGWLGASHEIAMAYYQDFIHTPAGHPVVAFLDDNRDDLLRRFPRHVEQFRQLLYDHGDRFLTFVVDRAIYSIEDLQRYRDEHKIYVITWEKDCGDVEWMPKDGQFDTFSFMRYRNHARDTRTYRVEYYSEDWGRDPTFRRYIVKIYKGTEHCKKVLSVITTNPNLPGETVLLAILCRWVQENNILYLINHNGINEITSYGKVDYADIAETLEDRQMANPELRKLCVEKMKLRKKLGVELVKHSDRKRQLDLEQRELKIMEEKISAMTTPDKDLEKEFKRRKASMKGKTTRFEKAAEILDRRQVRYEEEMAGLEAKLKTSQATISRMEKVIEENYQKLNFGPKSVMDAVRILAHNIFRELQEEFRPLYNNYRNDNRILRELICASALISLQSNVVKVALIPTRHYERKQRRRINRFLDQLNQRTTATEYLPPFRFSIYAPR